MSHLYRYVKTKNFEFLGKNLYGPKELHLIESTRFQKYRGWVKVYFRHPDGTYDECTRVPKRLNSKELKAYLVEFKNLQSSGHLPKKSAKKIRAKNVFRKDGTFSVFINDYFTVLAVEERTKLEKSESPTRSCLKSCFYYFEKNLGKFSITDLTDEDIIDFKRDLHHAKKMNGKLISSSTRINRRKNMKAALNTAKQNGYPLLCDPDRIKVHEYTKGGKKDHSKEARYVMFPGRLIEAIQKCSYPDPVDPCEPNMKRVVMFLEEGGLRPGETYNLSDYNFDLSATKYKNIFLMDLPEAPNGKDSNFTLKTENSKRAPPLTIKTAEYFVELISNLKNEKRYGTHKGELIEFPFLFVYRDKVSNKLVRNDQRFNAELQAIIEFAMKEFNLTYEGLGLDKNVKLEIYDLRRSCNYRLKIKNKYTDEMASRFLGHSVETNKKHYTIPEDHYEILRDRMEQDLKVSMMTAPGVAEEYAHHFTYENEEEYVCASS